MYIYISLYLNLILSVTVLFQPKSASFSSIIRSSMYCCNMPMYIIPVYLYYFMYSLLFQDSMYFSILYRYLLVHYFSIEYNLVFQCIIQLRCLSRYIQF